MPSDDPMQPRMSYVIVTDGYDTIRPVMERLRAQTARDQLEIVLVAPSRQALALDQADVAGFAGVRVVEIGAPLRLGHGRAAGVRAASAPIVFIGETHSFPHPTMAEVLLQHHESAWTFVVPGFGNANPDGGLSWAEFVSDYGQWAAGLPACEIHHAPLYNGAYKRAALLEVDGDLEFMLSHGDALLNALRARGHTMYFAPAARIDHLNVSERVAFVRERFLSGLLIAGTRSRPWGWARRLLHFCSAPLLPALYLWRIRKGVSSILRVDSVPRSVFPVLLAGAVMKAAGEMVGYARGAGSRAEESMREYEVHKVRHTSMKVSRATS